MADDNVDRTVVARVSKPKRPVEMEAQLVLALDCLAAAGLLGARDIGRLSCVSRSIRKNAARIQSFGM